MNKSKPVALIAAGKLTDSPLSRFRGLVEKLGPVKSPSFRLASRISNSLRAGRAVKDYDELNGSRLLLIGVPDDMVPSIVSELLESNLDWPGKTVFLCSTLLDSGALAPLAARGASVASITTIPAMEDRSYLLEGSKQALRESRLFVGRRGNRIVTILPGRKAAYLNALNWTGSVLFSVIFAASESLRDAGISSAVSAAILDKQMNRTLRTYLKGGRKAFPHPHPLPFSQVQAALLS